MVIMIGSEQYHDSLQYKMYLKLTQGRLSAQQILARHLSRLMTKYSMQRLKSEIFVVFMSIIQCKYNGYLPERKPKSLLAIPDIGPKQNAVTLNSMGLYDKLKELGPGADTHVIKCFSPMLQNEGVNPTNDKLVEMVQCIPVHLGIDTK